jgi:hypothetical protein
VSPAPALRLTDVWKSFGPVVANAGASLDRGTGRPDSEQREMQTEETAEEGEHALHGSARKRSTASLLGVPVSGVSDCRT